METAQIDANEISQHPEIIKGAQKEIIKQDVLVCGGCHAVFHFIEDFSSHKEKSCSEESHLKDCREVKAKVWAFLLWKGAQVGYDSTSINSWQLYQEWIKMDSELRETWIVAGKNVQTFAKMGHGGVQELPNKSNKINSNLNDKKQGLKGSKNALVNDLAMRGIEVKTLQTNNKKDEDKDWSAESEVESDEDKSSKSVNTRKESDKENKVSTTVPNLPAVEIKTIKKDSIGDLKDSNMRLALRTCKANDADRGLPTGEYTVEKILAKRFNPRRKQHEYLLKWEGYSHENNTWEPAEHMNSCRNLLEQFEKQLAKQKEQRAAAAQRALQLANQQNSGEKNKGSASVTTPVNSSGRPQRNSKVKAMDHMKQWVGHINDDSDSGTKRKADSDSDSEISEKRMKTDNQLSKVTKPQQQSNLKVTQVTRMGVDSNVNKSVNGLANKNDPPKTVGSESPDALKPPIVVSSAKGIVKVDPKQIPNLSSGVYIMSKNSGIIKLDSSPSPGGVVLVKDGKKHPTISPIRSVKKVKSEAHVKVIQEGENLQSGIVRVNSQSTINKTQPSRTLNQNMRVQTVQKLPMKTQAVTKPAAVKPLKTVPNKLSPVSQIKRTSVTPGKMYGRGRGGKLITSEPRNATLLKSTDNAMSKLSQEDNKKMLVNKTLSDKPDSDDEDSDPLDLFPTDLPPPEPSSPPRPLTLCPITGKVLAQAEGEPTPEPSPEPSTDHNSGINSNTASEALMNVQMSPGGTTGTLISSSTGNEEASIKLTDTLAAQSDDLPVSRKLFSTTSDGTAVAEEDQDDDQPLMITGEDGTIYQVAGENAEGQTVLVAQGADGEQQCVYVTASEQDGSLALDTAVAEAVAHMLPAQRSQGENQQQYFLKESHDEDSNTLPTEELMVQTNVAGVTDDNDGQVVAEVVQADLPSPGGTRRVVLLLPDGNFMMTEVDEEQFAALNLSS